MKKYFIDFVLNHYKTETYAGLWNSEDKNRMIFLTK